jgi:hypothetical protein
VVGAPIGGSYVAPMRWMVIYIYIYIYIYMSVEKEEGPET